MQNKYGVYRQIRYDRTYRPLGKMTVGVSGSEEQLNGLLEYLKEIKVDAEVIKHADLAE